MQVVKNMITKMTLRKTKEDDLMLDQLKVVTGINTKAPALLKVGHSYLELMGFRAHSLHINLRIFKSL